MTEYVLDTDTCIYWLNGDAAVEGEILRVGTGKVAITVITECELVYGAQKSSRPDDNLGVVERLRSVLRVIHTNPEVAPVYGTTKAQLERQGRRLDDADLLIAAIARSIGATLVTNNTRHFERVPGLRLENWRPSS